MMGNANTGGPQGDIVFEHLFAFFGAPIEL